jgi:hypothetical protein
MQTALAVPPIIKYAGPAMIEVPGRTRARSLPFVRVCCAALFSQVLCTAPALADDRTEDLVAKAEWLERRGQNEQAQELLRRAAQGQPKSELVAMARAQAYLSAKNPFWALKVLGEFIAQSPPACASRALAAWIHIHQANLDPAEQILDATECEHAEESKLRILLLRTEIAELRRDRAEAKELLLRARGISTRYTEDDDRLVRLLAKYDAEHEPALAFKLELGAGWASRGIGTLPLDLSVPNRAAGSAFLGADLRTRLVAAGGASVRPVAEAELHLEQYLETPARDLSSRQPLVRFGAEIGRDPRRLFVAYAADFVNIDGGSQYSYGSFSYSQAHRLEYRIQLGRSLQTYGSFGRRWFWQSARSRLESELGLSKTFAVSDLVTLLTGFDWRVYKAEANPYDQVGATLRAGLDISLPKGFELHESVSVSEDVFPRSAGYFDPGTLDHRRDTLVRAAVGLLGPETLGVRVGVAYGYAKRDSSANPYDFSDNRGILSVTWQSDSDRLRVRRIPKAGRVAMPYPDDEPKSEARHDTDVIEVIRKEETERSNTSCMK